MKNAWNFKIRKYRNSRLNNCIPIVVSPLLKIYTKSYSEIAKYVNKHVLFKELAYWLSRMICEKEQSYILGAQRRNENRLNDME
jgi:hypothetical protein